MRITLILTVLLLFMMPSILAAGEERTYQLYNSSHCDFDHMSIDLDDGSVIMKVRGRERHEIEITEDYELYIDDDLIETNDGQKKLLADYHGQCFALVREAKEIGFAGAKIGLEGAKLGLGAVTSLIKLLDDDYDLDDYEHEIEMEAEELEKEAELLEEQAEELEEMAEELEEKYEILEEEISELGELE